MKTFIDEQGGSVIARGRSPSGELFAALGEWSIAHANHIETHIAGLLRPASREIVVSLGEIDTLDTSGAWLLLKLRENWMKEGRNVIFSDVSAEHQILLNAISKAADDMRNHRLAVDRRMGFFAHGSMLCRFGWEDTMRILSLLGALMAAFFKRLRALFLGIFGLRAENDQTFRLPALVTHMMRTGLTAIPIVSLMSFLIGGIVAQQGAYQLSFYGADIMAVDLVAVLVTRDMGVLLTAIMVAGRSGSAYTAEIGSMKMREEIDALKVIGLDPVDVLLFPRILALVLVLPFLTVIADYASLLGAQVALWLYIDMSWQIFLQRTQDAVPLTYFLMGIIKAPFMALIIGLIAMSEGLRVAGSSESLSRHTTASVVKSIFMVIVIDGIFSVISASLGY